MYVSGRDEIRQLEPPLFTMIGIRPAMIPLLFLGLLCAFAFLLPFFILMVVLFENDGGGGFTPFPFLISWGFGYFPFRILSWNLNGREEFEIREGKLHLQSRSNWFKFKDLELELEGMCIEIIRFKEIKPKAEILDNLEKEYIAKYVFSNKGLKIESHLTVFEKQIHTLLERIPTKVEVFYSGV